LDEIKFQMEVSLFCAFSALTLLVGRQEEHLACGRSHVRVLPCTSNALPDHIRTVADPAKFRKLLEAHYFSQAFNIC